MKPHTESKSGLHPRNRHQGRYDFAALTQKCPELAAFVFTNQYQTQTIDFADPKAVKTLNKALLALHYGINHWDLPEGYLCPPIPGRVDYLHRVADLLAEDGGEPPKGKAVRVLDIGMGANCIYPLLGAKEYGWSFVGSDIDPVSVRAAQLLAESNGLAKQIECRLQPHPKDIFRGIIGAKERFALTVCNPPFHASMAEATAGTQRKLRNLGLDGANAKAPKLNFGGQKAELWCDGGEAAFLELMIQQSQLFATQCGWFSSLVSKKENLPTAKKALARVGAKEIKVLEMTQGNKVSRILVWSFLNTAERALLSR